MVDREWEARSGEISWTSWGAPWGPGSLSPIIRRDGSVQWSRACISSQLPDQPGSVSGLCSSRASRLVGLNETGRLDPGMGPYSRLSVTQYWKVLAVSASSPLRGSEGETDGPARSQAVVRRRNPKVGGSTVGKETPSSGG